MRNIWPYPETDDITFYHIEDARHFRGKVREVIISVGEGVVRMMTQLDLGGTRGTSAASATLREQSDGTCR